MTGASNSKILTAVDHIAHTDHNHLVHLVQVEQEDRLDQLVGHQDQLEGVAIVRKHCLIYAKFDRKMIIYNSLYGCSCKFSLIR